MSCVASPSLGCIWYKLDQLLCCFAALLRNDAALSFDCAGNLYAVTGANGAGETFTQAMSLLRITPATGAAVTVCTFPSTERVQVGAFATATTFVHFYGASPPQMETLTLTGQSGVCRTRCA